MVKASSGVNGLDAPTTWSVMVTATQSAILKIVNSTEEIARTRRIPRLRASVLRFVKTDGSEIISAMQRVTTKPVIGTVEIATSRRRKKEATNLNANLKNPTRVQNIGKKANVLLDVESEILCGTCEAMATVIPRATTKPVIGTRKGKLQIATKNTVKIEQLTEADVLSDV